MNIVIIDNYDSFTYNLYQAFATELDSVKVFRHDAISVAQLAAMDCDGVVLSPGPGRPEQSGICIETIKTLSPTVPLLGVCLGHQAMAIAFGGTVVIADEIVHGKPTEVYHQNTPLFKRISSPFTAGRYHSLIVERHTLPACLQIEAETKDGLIMGMKHQSYPCYGIQFHPESVLTPDGQQLINNFIGICAEFSGQKE